MARYYQGLFKPLHPEKYRGDPTRINYRSSWELRLMTHFDTHPDVVWWSSEEKIIPYRSPVDNRVHRYFPDFLIHTRSRDGKTKTTLIEVKPKHQTIPPKPQSGKSQKKRYLAEVMTWGVNQQKWKAAEDYCKDRGWHFMVMTEDHIFGTNNK